MQFFVLRGQPAVFLEEFGRAYVLSGRQPTGSWVPADPSEVQQVGTSMPEEQWRAHFRAIYGRITLANPAPRYRSWMALAMAETLQRVGAKYGEEETKILGQALEERARAALRASKKYLDRLN